ncbi:MAG TPA: bifunctional 5,10-methylenetetrahydrofolate dehydrogenase/5,10-methenyltetrahydrofolate cyclohydrolase [Bacilli bacterium]
MLLDGKIVSSLIRNQIKNEVKSLGKITLLVILVGDNSASKIYVHYKQKACKEVGINCTLLQLDKNITEAELIKIIDEANTNEQVHGILVQLPLPPHLDSQTIINHINPYKDVDGLTVINQGKLFNNLDCIVPATPKGVISLLDYYHIDITSKKAIVIGRSNLVGKPLAMLLLHKNATVITAHSKTKDLGMITKECDIVISAVGKPLFITKEMIKKDAVVVDVGISRINDKVVGDVAFEEVKNITSFITPVPGGVGPMTIASLLENVITCYKKLKGSI